MTPANKPIVSPSKLLAFSLVAWFDTFSGEPSEEPEWWVVLLDALEAVFVAPSPLLVGVEVKMQTPDTERASIATVGLLVGWVEAAELVSDVEVGPLYVTAPDRENLTALCIALSDKG